MSENKGLLLILDDSEESRKLERAVKGQGVAYRVVRNHDPTRENVPAIETPFGIVRGYANLATYFDLGPD